MGNRRVRKHRTMYRELALLGRDLNSHTVKEALFIGLECGMHGFCFPQIFIPEIKDIIPEGIVLSTVIDYPLGLTQDMRQKTDRARSIIEKTTG